MVYSEEIRGLTVYMRSTMPEEAEATYNMRIDKEKTKYMHQVNGTVEDQRAYLERQQDKPGEYIM